MIKTKIKAIRNDYKQDQIAPYEPTLNSMDFETFSFIRYCLPEFSAEHSEFLPVLFGLLTKRNIDGLLPINLRNYVNINGYADGAFGFLYHSEIELMLEEVKRIKSRNTKLKNFIKTKYQDPELVKKFHDLVDKEKLLNKLIKDLTKIEKGDIVICSLNKLKN